MKPPAPTTESRFATPPSAGADLRDTLTGVGLAALSTSLGGVTVVLTRLIIAESDPLSLAFLRYGIALAVLAAILVATTRLPRIARADLAVVAALGLTMFSGFPYFMARALEDTTAARGALVFATLPLVTIAIGALFRVERLTALKLLGIAVAIAGTGLALGERVDAAAPDALHGDAFMFLAILCAAFFNVFSGRYLIRYGTLPIMVYTMIPGIAVLFALALAFGRPFTGSLDFDLEGWTIVLLLAVPGAAFMTFIWGRALQLITPTQATITVGLNPVTAILLGAWLLSEPITLRVFAGVVMLVVAIVLANKRPRRPAPG